MIVQEKTNRVVNNLGETHTFKIQTSAKAFDILSDKLYKDKILAVIRETVTNGIDSHIAAGQTAPVQVHVPTLEEVFFSVKDTGLGLSQEDVIHMYTTYFSSTKAETNEFVGGLGLGSKSPFSYTDQFQVVSIFNGVKMVFSAFKSERNEPNIVLVSCDDTLDHNGLEVIVPVQLADVQQFRAKCNLTLFWMKDKITTNVEFKYNLQRSNFMYSDLFEVLDVADLAEDRTSISGTFVKIGTSVYPVDINQVGRLLDGRYYEIYNYKFGSGVIGGYARTSRAFVINVGIGVLDVAPSREELSYDKRTVSNLVKIMKLATDDLDAVVLNNIGSVRSPYLRQKRAVEVSNLIGSVKGITSYNDNVKITVNGVTSYDIIRYGKNDNKKMESVKVSHLELSPTRKIVLMDVGADYGKNKLNHQIKRVVNFGNNNTALTVLAFAGRPSKQLTDLIGTEEYVTFVPPAREAHEKIEGGVKVKVEPLYSSMAGGKFTAAQIKNMKNVYFIDYVSRKDDWTYKTDLNYEYLRTQDYEVLMLNKFEQKKITAKTTDELRRALPKIFGDVVTARQTNNYVEELMRNKIAKLIISNDEFPVLKDWMSSDLFINRNLASKAEVSHRLMNMMSTVENTKVQELKTEWDNYLKSNLILKMLVDNWASWKGLSHDEEAAVVELINSAIAASVKIA